PLTNVRLPPGLLASPLALDGSLVIRPYERWHGTCSLPRYSAGKPRGPRKASKGDTDDAKQGCHDRRGGRPPRRSHHSTAPRTGVLRADREEGWPHDCAAPRLRFLRADRQAGRSEGQGALRSALLRSHRKDRRRHRLREIWTRALRGDRQEGRTEGR